MKKTLFATLSAMSLVSASYADTVTTTFKNLTSIQVATTSETGLTYTPDSMTPGASGMNTSKLAVISGSNVTVTNSSGYSSATFTINLDLTTLQASTGDTLLLEFKNPSSETSSIGLMYSAGNGLAYAWEGKKWTTASYLTDTWINSNENVYTGSNGHKYITLAICTSASGTGIYEADGTILAASSSNSNQYRWSGLKSSNNLSNVAVNSAYINAIAITNADLTNSTSSIPAIAATVVPEPATATLSLLALAGLAARRRRK